MTSLIKNIFCCAGNCLCYACNNICEDSKKINPKLFARIGFIILGLISVGFSLFILYYGAGILKPFDSFIQCPKENNLDCLGISSIYRMSFTMVCLHFIVILFSLFGQNCANVLNRDCWTFKILFICGVYFGFLFIPNSFFLVYAEIARYLSVLFLIYQILVTISFAHVLNYQLIDGLDETSEFKYKFWLLFLFLLFTGFILFWTIISLINFSDEIYNIFIVTLSFVFGCILTGISISNTIRRKRLLTSLYIFSFMAYMTWSSLNSQPREIQTEIKYSLIDILVGLFYLFMAVSYLGFYIKKEKISESDSNEQKEIKKNPVLEEEKNEEEKLTNQELSDYKNINQITTAHFYFHVFMIFMSVYYSMLLTNWTIVEGTAENFILIPQNLASFWIKLSGVFVSGLLYLWVMLAPIIFPDREFDF